MISGVIMLSGCLAGLVMTLPVNKFSKPHRDHKAPPLISSSISITGHLIGLLNDSSGYYFKIDYLVKPSRKS